MEDRMTQRQLEERRKRRERRKKERLRRVRMMKALLCVGMLAICVVLGAVASRGISGRQAEIEKRNAEAVMAESAAAAAEAEADAAQQKSWADNLPEVGAIYGIYVNEVGWSHFFADNSYSMAPVGKYISAIRATVHNQPADMTGTIEYSVNSSGYGWMEWTENGNGGGDETGAAPLEAIAVRLTGELGEQYDVLYSVLQNNAWTDWVRNGETAGQEGVGLRVDGVRMSIVKKIPGQENYAGNIDPNKPMVALTYDDGPSAQNTARILAKLQEYGGRATFFMVGQQAEKNMGLVKQMAEQGCEVANHTYDHKLMSKVAPEEMASQLARTNQVISDACGISPILMRPCGGDRCEAGMNVVGAISMPAVLWSVDTLDWKTRDAQNTVQTTLDTVQDGDIILMHDLYDATADASDTLIPELINRGYQLVTVSELASYRGGMLPGKTYSHFRP